MNKLDPMTRAMFGENAQHVPMWMYVQDQGGGIVTFVGSSKHQGLRYNSLKTHQFILGEMIVRPHLVLATNRLAGHGLGHLVEGGTSTLFEADDLDILCDPMGKAKQVLRRYHEQAA